VSGGPSGEAHGSSIKWLIGTLERVYKLNQVFSEKLKPE